MFVPSLTVIVIGAVPNCPGEGERFTVRFVALPPKVMPDSGSNERFTDETDNVSPAAGVSAS